LAEEKIEPEVVENMRTWPHSGFHVDQSVYLPSYRVPYRCLYSRNVENLLMAGKHISVTHVAGSSTKTMLNGGQHGVAAGAAAFLCKKHGTTPRGVYQQHLPELQEIVFGRNEHARDPKPQ
jgi:hypothetical protein